MTSDFALERRVIAIQGNHIQPGIPTDGYALTWNASANEWQPKPITVLANGLHQQHFTSDGYWTCPDGITTVMVSAAGGGGGGSGGAAGLAGTTADYNGPGGDGEDTLFGSLYSWHGAQGGSVDPDGFGDGIRFPSFWASTDRNIGIVSNSQQNPSFSSGGNFGRNGIAGLGGLIAGGLAGSAPTSGTSSSGGGASNGLAGIPGNGGDAVVTGDGNPGTSATANSAHGGGGGSVIGASGGTQGGAGGAGGSGFLTIVW